MERQVEQFIQSLSDLDLLEYTRTQAHLPEALEFARVEMTERRWPAGHLAQLEQELRQRQLAREEEARAAGLGMASGHLSLRPVFRPACTVVRADVVEAPQRRGAPEMLRHVALCPGRFLLTAHLDPRANPALELACRAHLVESARTTYCTACAFYWRSPARRVVCAQIENLKGLGQYLAGGVAEVARYVSLGIHAEDLSGDLVAVLYRHRADHLLDLGDHRGCKG